ncbi:hypothetical protein [Anatilimnocola aggregata]|uniref:hypothetical protein n=1 Tax=Anatilimnocola aggregata TaxID=2528021 RepID=UPI00119E3A9A|nr:hypothetical protein [Anatilimnocola aggregata]
MIRWDGAGCEIEFGKSNDLATTTALHRDQHAGVNACRGDLEIPSNAKKRLLATARSLPAARTRSCYQFAKNSYSNYINLVNKCQADEGDIFVTALAKVARGETLFYRSISGVFFCVISGH